MKKCSASYALVMPGGPTIRYPLATISSQSEPGAGAASWAIEHMRTLRENSGAEKTLNSMRDEVFRQCGDAGEMAPGLFTLTAPTGIGKTLALLHFALRHCAAHSKRRIILVLPYLTLTEQSQREYENLFPYSGGPQPSRLSEEERDWRAVGTRRLS